MLTELTLLPSSSVFHRIMSFCKTLFGSIFFSYWATVLISSADHSGVCAMWQGGFSPPMRLSPFQVTGVKLHVYFPIFISLAVCMLTLLYFFSLFSNHQSPAMQWKNVAWFSMNSVEVPKGKSKHLYLE